ncbi:hypothetical protein Bbelb_096290 [Branchiostoma belcheri]|nr:hypothetical protein Bbelb_096290 [Branchiostoma belcheri]
MDADRRLHTYFRLVKRRKAQNRAKPSIKTPRPVTDALKCTCVNKGLVEARNSPVRVERVYKTSGRRVGPAVPPAVTIHCYTLPLQYSAHALPLGVRASRSSFEQGHYPPPSDRYRMGNGQISDGMLGNGQISPGMLGNGEIVLVVRLMGAEPPCGVDSAGGQAGTSAEMCGKGEAGQSGGTQQDRRFRECYGML